MVAVNPDGTPGDVAANELIESAWGNAVADSITYLRSFGVEWRHVATSIPPGSLISTTPWDLQPCVMPVRGNNRLCIVTAGILFARSAGTDTQVDAWLRASDVGPIGPIVRVRCNIDATTLQAGGLLTTTYFVPANATATFNMRLSASATPINGGTLGGGDLCFIHCAALAMPGPIAAA